MLLKKLRLAYFRRNGQNTKNIIIISAKENKRNRRKHPFWIPGLPCQTSMQSAIKPQQVSFFIRMVEFLTFLKCFQ